jgi:hypothetical protein
MISAPLKLSKVLPGTGCSTPEPGIFLDFFKSFVSLPAREMPVVYLLADRRVLRGGLPQAVQQ